MNVVSAISIISFLLACGMCLLIWRRGWSLAVNRRLSVAAGLLAAELLLDTLSFHAPSPSEALLYKRMALVVAACLPLAWVLFIQSLTPGRNEQRNPHRRLVWLAPGLPAAVYVLSFPWHFSGSPILLPTAMWQFQMGPGLYLFHFAFIVGLAAVLFQFERILRSSYGKPRHQIKYMLVGFGGLFALRIFTASQNLLYTSIFPEYHVVNAGALGVAVLFTLVTLARSKTFQFEIYVSRTALHHSIALVIVGAFLIGAAAVAELVSYFDWTHSAPAYTFILFAALLASGIILLSESVWIRIRQIVSRHFKRPQYDYRNLWRDFTEQTVSITEIPALANRLVRFASETIGVSSVSLWLLDPDKTPHPLKLAASTRLDPAKVEELDCEGAVRTLLGESASRSSASVLDCDQLLEKESGSIRERFDEMGIRSAVPIRAREQVFGLLTLGRKEEGEPLSTEDGELIHLIAGQAAAALLNIRLARENQRIRQLEAYRNFSAFVVHDLKNLASRFSLTVNNLPKYFAKPELQEQAVERLRETLEDIRQLCQQLDLLRGRIHLDTRPVEVNEFVGDTLQQLKPGIRSQIREDFRKVPVSHFDSSQMAKVLTNLLLNADEATQGQGTIQVSTSSRNGTIRISVRDDGCGISEEFLKNRLFKPFETTKKNGMGIGLFHCKAIVELHRGKLEVESSPGQGSVFRVILPVRGSTPASNRDSKRSIRDE